ncbi:FMN-dependent dehydrogenase-domain-containing protein [Aspergillus cavernicola]|uniref:FMN-dependent dehydrogenase-domain-containing protein n=1 Tax=Aspergillus cavernicola TaxID=176166 RepID=A0ABR4HI92_9EURO
MYTLEEVAQHKFRHSCWVVIKNHAYDVTQFLDEHLGGAGAILQHAGKDATAVYEALHPPGIIEQLPQVHNEVQHRSPNAEWTPNLDTLQNLEDFEHVAKLVLSPRSWAYYSSGAEDLRSFKNNRNDWAKITLRPRVLRNVARVSLRSRIMGHESSLPVFISPTALARLGHPDGELCLARGAARHNVVYAVSTYSSTSHEQVAACCEAESALHPNLRFGGGAVAFQLYLPLNKVQGGRERIAKAKALGYQELVVTVDTAVIGKREADEGLKAELGASTLNSIGAKVQCPGEPGNDTPDDFQWIKAAWGSGPIIIKGIQTVEDALRASEAGVQGIYLSNHGGRQLDHAPSSTQTLLEINYFCPDILKKVEVYLDGGVRRGTDVIKAVCLGATGSGYGTDGVVKALQPLSDEIETALRLMGVVDISELDPTFLNTTALDRDLVSTQYDSL